MKSPLRAPRAVLAALLLATAAIPFPSSARAAELVHAPLLDRYWCLARLVDRVPLCGPPCEFDSLTDLDRPGAIRARLPEVVVRENAGAHDRYLALKGFPIAEVTSAPGHAYLKNPAQIAALKNHVAGAGGGDFAHDPLLFNIVTGADGKVVTVDLWNAHHRLVAYLEAGYHFLDEIPEKNFKILVNGKTTEGNLWAHYVPAAGLDETAKIESWVVPVAYGVRPGTVSVDGRHANFTLGARSTIGRVRRNTLYRKRPRIGVYFGSFDPPHAGHLDAIRRAIEAADLDEVLIVPNVRTPVKPDLAPIEARLEMLREFIRGESKLNVYVGDSSLILERYGHDPFYERMTQIYGTRDVFQIVGEESFAGTVARGDFRPIDGRKLIVVPRPAGASEASSFAVPANLKESVVLLPSTSGDPRGLSSAFVRRLISEGKPTDESVLAPGVRRVANDRGLYRAR